METDDDVHCDAAYVRRKDCHVTASLSTPNKGNLLNRSRWTRIFTTAREAITNI